VRINRKKGDMKMITKLILGGVLGGLIGAAVGYAGKCAGGSCPLACNPIGGTLFGALIGALMVSSAVSAPVATEKAATGAAGGEKDKVVQIQDAAQMESVLAKNKVVLVDFYADWCGPCRMLKPTIHEIASEYEGRVAVVSVNVDNAGDVAEKYGISSIPDIRIFADGKSVERLIGVRTKKDYTDLLDKLAPATDRK
jgi:thioredoxin 1